MREGLSTAPDYYALLALSPAASQTEIRAAYLELIRQEHPDRSLSPKAAEERAALLNEAYATLGDPARRAVYDGQRSGSLAKQGHAPRRSAVARTLDLFDMNEEDQGFSAPCRCGELLFISFDDVAAANGGPILRECDGCSERTKIETANG